MSSSTSSPAQPFQTLSSLLSAALRARNTDSIQPFEETLVRTLQRETRALHEQLETARKVIQSDTEQGGTMTLDDGVVCSLSISALTARRNKRVLLAYAMQRRNALLDAYWSNGASLPSLLAASPSNVSGSASSSAQSEAVGRVLTPAEMDYIRAHAGLVNDLSAPYHSYTVSLTSSLARGPPKELYVQVKCLKDLGEVVVGDGGGVMCFERGSRYYVKRAEVERLLEGRWLEEVVA